MGRDCGPKIIIGKPARFSSAHHWWGHSWSSDSSYGPPSARERWTYWKGSSKVPLKWLRAWSIFHTRKDQEWVQRGWSWALFGGAQCQEKRQWPQRKIQEVPAEHQETLIVRMPKQWHRLLREVVESPSFEVSRSSSLILGLVNLL